MKSELKSPPEILFRDLVTSALQEDLRLAGDLTSEAIVEADEQACATAVARQEGCLAGLAVFGLAFRLLDPGVEFEARVADGEQIQAGTVLATVRGKALALLAAERTALNFLGRLSGIATATQAVVRSLEGTAAKIVCTRKTTPNLRVLEKYAIRAGGGSNHRFNLADAVLIKDNHLALAGSIREAVGRVRSRVGHLVKIQVEVDDLHQLEEALELGVEAILLDNMSVEQVQEAVRKAGGRCLLEVSGGLTPETVHRYAETGVDLLSLGWLTHSSPAFDVSLEIEIGPPS